MSNDLTILIVLFLLFTIGSFFLSGRRKSRRGRITYLPQSAHYYANEDDELTDFPYRLKDSLLTPGENSFFLNLRSVVADRAIIVPQAVLGEIFWVHLEDKALLRGYRNKIDRKRVDFLLCDPRTMQPLLGIELDDKSHQREDRQTRDAFVDGVFAAAGLPLIHIPVRNAYVANDLVALLAPYLPRTGAARPLSPAPRVAIPEPVKAATNGAHPKCPKCGSEMILRTSKSGVTAGTQFWGCSNFPNCRGMVPYQA
ncbi:MAG: DUF2726 domain-containing protein [Chloroflexi bacterium]|nr:DUF2726 domain-containing protein [Chloroflexota bacterium]